MGDINWRGMLIAVLGFYGGLGLLDDLAMVFFGMRRLSFPAHLFVSVLLAAFAARRLDGARAAADRPAD